MSLSSVMVGGDDAVVGRAVVVLDLLERDDVGRAEVVDDQAGEPVELRLRVARVEVLDVERRDRELVRRRGASVDLAARCRRTHRRQRGRLEHEVAEVVVERRRRARRGSGRRRSRRRRHEQRRRATMRSGLKSSGRTTTPPRGVRTARRRRRRRRPGSRRTPVLVGPTATGVVRSGRACPPGSPRSRCRRSPGRRRRSSRRCRSRRPR